MRHTAIVTATVAALLALPVPAVAMPVFVKTLSGRTITLEVTPTDAVEDVKAMLTSAGAPPPGYLRLLYAGQELQDSRTLGDYNVQREATLHVRIPINGGLFLATGEIGAGQLYRLPGLAGQAAEPVGASGLSAVRGLVVDGRGYLLGVGSDSGAAPGAFRSSLHLSSLSTFALPAGHDPSGVCVGATGSQWVTSTSTPGAIASLDLAGPTLSAPVALSGDGDAGATGCTPGTGGNLLVTRGGGPARSSDLASLDPSTGALWPIGHAALDFTDLTALLDGTVVATTAEGRIYLLDASSGAATMVADTGVAGVQGLAYAPPVSCTFDNGLCGANEVCTDGPFQACGPCRPGFEYDAGGACQDVDECAVDNGHCALAPATDTCTNTPGSWSCATGCQPGFQASGGLPGPCVDVDECAAGIGGCDPRTTCTNLPGAFECGPCPAGFSGSGATGCLDVDECAVANGGCDPRTTCTNLPGTFECGPCHAGFTGSGATGCLDVDECAVANGGCDPRTACTNLPGTFECGPCPAGFSGSGATGCADLDECAVADGGCDPRTTCTNLPGTFECGPCPAGFSGSGATGCADLDECAVANGGCSTDAACTNTAGSFRCECRPGFTGDGMTCAASGAPASSGWGCTTSGGAPGAGLAAGLLLALALRRRTGSAGASWRRPRP